MMVVCVGIAAEAVAAAVVCSYEFDVIKKDCSFYFTA